MPESYLTLPPSDQKDILLAAADALDREAAVLEKDIWVCWALQAIFNMPDAHPMAFKGGTSLSKVYGVIHRFSEDIDITLDYRRFDDDFDPFAANASNTQIRKFSDRLKSYVKTYANDRVAPYLRSQLQDLPTAEHQTIKVDKIGEKIEISYPSTIESADEYLKSEVLIELGGRNVINPNETHTITPDVAAITHDVEYPTGEVVVLSPERTFWEKATLIHVECNRGQLKENAERLSRHWYDLTMLAKHNTGKAAINNREIFEDVIKHKKAFFNSGYADYDACLNGELKLLPDDSNIHELKNDYEKMMGAGMIYESPPTFDHIVRSLHKITEEVNSW